MAGEAAAAEQEIAITIIPDADANVEAATTEAKPEVAKVEVKDPALQDLMQQYKDLETRAEAAETRRRDAEREAAKHKAEAETSKTRETSSRLDTIKTALSASQEDVDRAKLDIKTARAAGDVDAESDAIDRMTTAKASLLRLDEAKQDMEARAKAPAPKATPPNDPVEAFVQNRTKNTADWIRAHPEYVQSEKGLRKLTAADAVAQAEDLIPDTAAYFARVEEYLGLTKKVEKAPIEAPQNIQPRRSEAPPVAPGAAVSSNGANGSPSVQLSSREAAAAQDGTHVWNWNDPNGKFKKGDPIGLQEMARRKLELQRRGAYDRSFTEG